MPHRSRTPRSLLLAGGVGVSLVLVAVAFGVRVSDEPMRAPSFLDPANPDVQAATRLRARFWEELAVLLRRSQVPDEQLWRTQGRFADPEMVAGWEAGRQVRFLSYPAWTVPADPTWTEDPFHSRAWVRTYQSLAWLRAPSAAFRETGDPRYAEEVRNYILDWIADNPRKGPATSAAWGDHATAYRTDLLVELFDPIAASGATPEEIETLLASLHLHGTALRGFLADPRFRGTNHGVYHAMSLYSLTNAFPELDAAAEWRAAARASVTELLTQLVEPDDGISTEQSASYHFLALSLFARVNAYLAQFSDGLTADELGVIRRMVEFGALLVQPDGTLPAVGDTNYGQQAPLALLKSLRQQGFTTPIADWILSDGEAGHAPPPMDLYPASGYALMRERGQAGRAARLLFDFGAFRRVHGHVDPLNVILADDSGPILVDSGGPFGYGDPGRNAFIAARAHNLILVDGRAPAAGTPVLGPVVDSPALSSVEARLRLIGGVEHRRTVIWARQAGAVIVIDRLRTPGRTPHRFELLFHVPPKARVALRTDGASLQRGDGTATRIRMLSSGRAAVDVIAGAQHPAIGWVTTGGRKRTRAPVIRSHIRADHGWFVTSFGLHGADPVVQARPLSGGRLGITIIHGGDAWRIGLPRNGAPTMSRLARSPAGLVRFLPRWPPAG